jgi:hypothetical protein
MKPAFTLFGCARCRGNSQKYENKILYVSTIHDVNKIGVPDRVSPEAEKAYIRGVGNA